MKHNRGDSQFQQVIDRRHTESIKWTYYDEDVLPMWVADMDFRCADPVLEALRERTGHGIFGYPNEPEELREVIVARLKRRFDWSIEAESIVFVPNVYVGFHLAAHAVVDDQRPWNSSLHFGTPEAPVELTAGAVADLNLGACLAVLASCESGGGEVLSGEGVLGLTSGFLSAGVPTVLATLWPVDDRATALLIRHFYEGLASGHTAACALRDAQIALRNESATAHPFYWAGFILVGDGTTTVPLAKQRRTVWPWIIGPLLIIGAVWPARWRRR